MGVAADAYNRSAVSRRTRVSCLPDRRGRMTFARRPLDVRDSGLEARPAASRARTGDAPRQRAPRPHLPNLTVRQQFGRLANSRLLWSAIVGISAGTVIGRAFSRSPGLYAADFTGVWRAAAQLSAGVDPYSLDTSGLPYPLGPLAYPLPAAIAAFPLGQLPAWLAAGIFVALGVAALAYVALGGPPFRLLILGTPCFVMAISLVQWSTVLTAAAVISPLGVLAVCKPNLGLALFVRRPTWWIVGGGAVLLTISIALVPNWIGAWLGGVSGMSYYVAPVAIPGGVILLLAALRWRDPDARLLLALSVVPSNLFLYDQLPLFLVARSRRDMFLLFAGSWLAPLVTKMIVPPWVTDEVVQQTYMRLPIVAFLFIPALYIVLSRRGTSMSPDLVDRILNRRLGMSLFGRSPKAAPSAPASRNRSSHREPARRG
jgi:hypothetical protein